VIQDKVIMEKEEEIIRLLKTGSEDAIKLIFDRYYIGLCLYADSILKDRYASEEVVEELFITIWVKAKDLTILTSLKNYLYRSVHNNSIKYLRKRHTEEKNIEKLMIHENECNCDASTCQFENLITQEIEDRANAILMDLPSRCREIYTLNRYENLSYPEIAEKLNIDLSTVKTQMSRAFEKFRTGLKDLLTVLFMILIS
jgi:RNA polymerase sigma-70 factor (ECF subfamily)